MDVYHVETHGGNQNIGPGGVINQYSGPPRAAHDPGPPTATEDPGGTETVVVLTALDVEHDAMATRLGTMMVHRHPAGTLFEVGALSTVRVALATVGPGIPTSAALAERAIAMFHPRALIFTGIAGALHDDLTLGDVVVGTHVYAYHGGQELTDEFLSRPRTWRAAHELLQLAQQASRTVRWETARPATVHFRPIASGDVLLNSRRSDVADHLRRLYNDAAAIEMEGAGAHEAAHVNRSLAVLSIRGISDYASGQKQTTDQEGWRRVAAANAAAMTCALLTAMGRPAGLGWGV